MDSVSNLPGDEDVYPRYVGNYEMQIPLTDYEMKKARKGKKESVSDHSASEIFASRPFKVSIYPSSHSQPNADSSSFSPDEIPPMFNSQVRDKSLAPSDLQPTGN